MHHLFLRLNRVTCVLAVGSFCFSHLVDAVQFEMKTALISAAFHWVLKLEWSKWLRLSDQQHIVFKIKQHNPGGLN
ncbi:hypothetical protein PROFUN_14035 [Planoprotostelium fungivorum]|uniref:Secreted protein n=1 Tax=Planoprotostelium fungivorum TaxID=1890364 RepID=A0A2P6N295_9EUKA|nr:hypothetical protein PROFUN_14035 [Planoprotostelium fungivorum]